MLPLIKFEYKNNKYFVEYDNKKLKYYSTKNNKKNYNLSKEEIKIIDYVVSQVTPSNNVIKLMDFNFNNRQYKMYLDKKTGLRLFKPTPSNKDSIALNKIFNNMEEYVAYNIGDRLSPHDNTPYFKRIIQVGVSTIIVCVLSMTMAMTILTSSMTPKPAPQPLYDTSYSEQEIEYTSKLPDEEYLSIITEAIKSNSNLSEKEKEAMLSNPNTFLDNKKSINIKYVEKVLKDLKIVYCKETIEHITGSYNYSENCIYFYGASCFEEVKTDTFYHEFSHVLTAYTSDINDFLAETTNTIFTTEYYIYDDNSYRNYINYTYALMEIIGSEPLKQYHNHTKLEYIIDPLYQIIPDYDKAYKLLALLENYKKIHDEMVFEKIDLEEGKQELDRLNEIIKSELNDYYQKKYNCGIEQDLFMLYYLDRDAFDQEMIKLSEFEETDTSFQNYQYSVSSHAISENTYFDGTSVCPKGIVTTTSAYTSPDSEHQYDRIVITSKDRYIYTSDTEEQSIVSQYPYFFESIDGLLKKELGTYDATLYRSTNHTKALIEIIGTEPLKEYYDTGNGEVIIKALCEVIPDYDKAINFISKLNEYASIEKTYDESKDFNIIFDMEDFAITSGIYDDFNDYYYEKTGIQIDDDLLILSYLKVDEFKTAVRENLLDEKQKEECYDCVPVGGKYYFVTQSDAIKVVIINNDKKNYHITINESNRYRTVNNKTQNISHK